MKVTKYPQSCLLIEDNGKRIIIDPGSFVTQKFKTTDLLPLDGILITHEHQDHADPVLIKALIGQTNILVIGNESTKNLLGDVVNKTAGDNEVLELAGFKIITRELPHCDMVDGSPGPQNTGYVINDIFFHPGDGTNINNLRVENSAIPIAGPDISPRDIFDFIKQINCKKIIPIHYDYFPGDPQFIANLINTKNQSIQVIILEAGESTEL